MTQPEPPLTLADVRHRSIRALAVLGLRGGAGRLVAMAVLVPLSRLLRPDDFGAFAILMVPIGLLGLLGDAGISGALIQRREDLSTHEEQVGFTLQLLLAVALGILALLIAGPVGRLYALSDRHVWALRALALGPLLSTPGLVPGVRLTRALNFDPLALAELGSLIAGQGVTLAAALLGGGIWSLVLGSLATALTGSLLVNLFAPWRPGLALSATTTRRLLGFGLRYQSQGLLHFAMEKAIPVLGGLFLGSTAVGYLVWAREIARWPRVPADYVARVGFAAFSRLQGDPRGLGRLVRGALALVSTFTFPVAILGAVLAPRLVSPIFGPGWAPAVLPLSLFLLLTPLDALATVLLPVIYAGGAAGRGLRISALWAALLWAATYLGLALGGGLAAIPAAFLLTTALMLLVIGRNLPAGVVVRWWRLVSRPGAVALLLAALGWLALERLP